MEKDWYNLFGVWLQKKKKSQKIAFGDDSDAKDKLVPAEYFMTPGEEPINTLHLGILKLENLKDPIGPAWDDEKPWCSYAQSWLSWASIFPDGFL